MSSICSWHFTGGSTSQSSVRDSEEMPISWDEPSLTPWLPFCLLVRSHPGSLCHLFPRTRPQLRIKGRHPLCLPKRCTTDITGKGIRSERSSTFSNAPSKGGKTDAALDSQQLRALHEARCMVRDAHLPPSPPWSYPAA